MIILWSFLYLQVMDCGMLLQMRYLTGFIIHRSMKYFACSVTSLLFLTENSQEAVAMIQSIEDPEQAAKRLLHEAYQRGSADNITCVVVRFLVGHGNTTTEQK